MKRVRQIVSEALSGRPVGDHETHVRLQIERLGPALKAAGAALARGDARAIRPLLKVLDQRDRYHAIARAWRADRADDPTRLVRTIERMAASPGDAAGAEPAETAAMAEGRPPPAPEAESDPRNFLGFIRRKPLKVNN